MTYILCPKLENYLSFYLIKKSYRYNRYERRLAILFRLMKNSEVINMDYVKYIRERVGHDSINLTGVNVLIINKDNQILLQKRGTFPYKWGLIGGITELGESLETTAVREVKEETGLNIKELTLLGTTSGEDCFIEFPHGDKAFFITIGYVCKSYSGKLSIDNFETKDLCFFSYDELPENIPRSHKVFIEKYYSI